MTKKPGKSQTPSPEFDREREFKVILESIGTDIKLLAEGQSALRDNQDITNDRLDSLETKVDRLEMKADIMIHELSSQKKDIGTMKVDIKDIKKMLGSHDKRISKLEIAA